MATSGVDSSVGISTDIKNGEFKDTVPEDYLCQRCKHVAREPHLTSCCGNHFCKACISPYQQDKQPCPTCGEVDFDLYLDKRRILSLEVYCSMRSRGCLWTGQLRQLEGHMEVESGDCTYVDTQCPSSCSQRVQKRNVESHLAEGCPLRAYTCKYCNFKASFRVVTEDHLPECPYYPIECPNRCGVTCEREFLEDHMKICCLEELECCFKHAGCREKFLREDEEKHMEKKAKEHLSLMAATTLKMSVMLDKVVAENEENKKKLLKQEEELKEEMDRKIDHLKAENEEKLLKQEEVLGRKFDQLKAENEDKLLKQEAALKTELDIKGERIAEVEAKCQDLERTLKQRENEDDTKFKIADDNLAELHSTTLATPTCFL